MAQQVVRAFFLNPIAAGTSWTLRDDTGVQSAGVCATQTAQLTMSVTVGLPLDHRYLLRLTDQDGALLETVKFDHADGGIIIIDNIGIGKDPKKDFTTSLQTKSGIPPKV